MLHEHAVCVRSVYSTYSSFLLFFFNLAQQPPVDQDLFHEVSRSRTMTTTVGRSPLDEGSARRRDLFLTKHNTHNRQTPVGFEPTISVGELLQTYALDLAATGTVSLTLRI